MTPKGEPVNQHLLLTKPIPLFLLMNPSCSIFENSLAWADQIPSTFLSQEPADLSQGKQLWSAQLCLPRLKFL